MGAYDNSRTSYKPMSSGEPSGIPGTTPWPSVGPKPFEFGTDPTQPFNIEAAIHALGGLQQSRQAGHLAIIKEGLMAPQTRHLGMGGEDITGKTGPYDSGGIDWLHAHGPTGAPPPVDVTARAQGNEMAMAHGAQPGGTTIPDTSLPAQHNGGDWLPNIGTPGEHMMLDRRNGMDESNFAGRSGGLSGEPLPGQPTIMDETGIRAWAPKIGGAFTGATPNRNRFSL